MNTREKNKQNTLLALQTGESLYCYDSDDTMFYTHDQATELGIQDDNYYAFLERDTDNYDLGNEEYFINHNTFDSGEIAVINDKGYLQAIAYVDVEYDEKGEILILDREEY